jgi:hypothetical protein
MRTLYITIILVAALSQATTAQNTDTLVLKQNLRVAAKAQLICEWGDPEYMELHTNKQIYTFKRGLEDGMYIAMFDKNLSWKKPLKDTAMVAVMENGKLNGLLRRWSDEDKMIEEECEYVNGMMNGYRKLYFYAPDGNKYTNIEFLSACATSRTISTALTRTR